MGIRVAIDDFGAGYTSLAYLKSLPVHTLKIDRAFITDMLEDRRDQAIAESIIGLGHTLGLSVLAEGIETEEVWRKLTALDCDEGQGYHLARPMPADRMADWVGTHLAVDTTPRVT
jgi:EAL domain-containing protein (putative c-di-GMP-specific phosphodiesterase class I)